MEISLASKAKPNLAVDEDIIEEVAREADRVEAPSQPEAEARGLALPRARPKASAP